MTGFFRKWFSSRATQEKPTTLPEELITKMGAKRFSDIQSDTKNLLQEKPTALDELLTSAKCLEWPQLQQDKLLAYSHFYLGKLHSAYQLAAPYANAEIGTVPFDSDMFMLAAIILYQNAQYEDADLLISRFSDDEKIFESHADYFSIKSSIAAANNRIEAAWKAVEKARKLDPENSFIAFNAYALAFRLPDYEAFEELKEKIATGKLSGSPNAFALATPTLAKGDYIDGFRILELRHQQSDAKQYVNPALEVTRRWREKISEWPVGKTLLVSCEQGVGDTIQICRFFPKISAITDGNLIIEVQEELKPLLETNYPTQQFISTSHGNVPNARYDYWIASMSIPYFLGCELDNIPHKHGYLAAPTETRAYWQARIGELSTRDIRVGVAWSGNPGHRADRQRSIPFKELEKYISKHPGIDFFVLQTSVPEKYPENLHDLSAELITFADTAGVIEQMDLIITVDTSVVHLAGAMGKETLLLLPLRYEWRWGLEGEDNAWYDSVKVIRQHEHGNWQAVLERVFMHDLPKQTQLHGES